MYTVFSFLAYAALACIFVALWSPRIYPLKNPTTLKAAGFYLVAFVVFFVLSGFVGSGDSKKGTFVPSALKEGGAAASEKANALTVLKKEKITMPKNGRDRLQVTLGMFEKQAAVTQQDLLALVTKAAVAHQKESGAPVVVVTLVCQKAENALGEAQLAQAIYIPDGKGFDGAGAAGTPWETLRVAKRGFSPSELSYLQLWAKRYQQYQSWTGVKEKELDAAISAELKVAPGSVQPFANTLEAVDAPASLPR